MLSFFYLFLYIYTYFLLYIYQEIEISCLKKQNINTKAIKYLLHEQSLCSVHVYEYTINNEPISKVLKCVFSCIFEFLLFFKQLPWQQKNSMVTPDFLFVLCLENLNKDL